MRSHLLSAALLASAFAFPAQAADSVKIGVIYPLTGNAAPAGNSAKDAVELGAEIVAEIASVRKEIGRDVKEPFDVVAALPVGTNPAPYASAGATWWMVEFPWDGVSEDQVRGVIRDGPAPSG